MTNVGLTGGTIQLVHSGSSGDTIAIPAVMIQLLETATAKNLNLAGSVIQLLEKSTAAFAEITFVNLQAIHQGAGEMEIPSSVVQPVYTIGVSDIIRQKAWTFDFDGHSFYVLDLAENGAMIFDITTGQWSRFDTPGFEGHWNMKNGFHWRSGQQVLGGAMDTPIVLNLDPTSFLDDGWRPVVYEVRGVIFATDVAYHRQFALQLIGSAGRTADTVSPVLKMQFSDDQGQTWSKERTVVLTADTRQRIEFRSLGAFTAPGRVFRLYDTGGIKFIAYVTADVEGAEE